MEAGLYEHTFSETPADTGIYLYMITVYKFESTYDTSTGMWTPYTPTELDTQYYAFSISYPGLPPPSPNLFSAIITYIINFLASLFN